MKYSWMKIPTLRVKVGLWVGCDVLSGWEWQRIGAARKRDRMQAFGSWNQFITSLLLFLLPLLLHLLVHLPFFQPHSLSLSLLPLFSTAGERVNAIVASAPLCFEC